MTTGPRMELMAAIAALGSLNRPCDVHVYSDSQYLVNGMERGWAQRWRLNGWQRVEGGAAKNADLWRRLMEACSAHEVSFHWIRAHSGDPFNERCHALASAVARRDPQTADDGYMPIAA